MKMAIFVLITVLSNGQVFESKHESLELCRQARSLALYGKPIEVRRKELVEKRIAEEKRKRRLEARFPPHFPTDAERKVGKKCCVVEKVGDTFWPKKLEDFEGMDVYWELEEDGMLHPKLSVRSEFVHSFSSEGVVSGVGGYVAAPRARYAECFQAPEGRWEEEESLE